MDIALLCAILATLIAVLFAFLAVGEELGRDFAIATIIVSYVVANLFVFGVSRGEALNARSTPKAPYTVAAGHFGLKSGKAYPLQLGSRFSGTSGDMSVSGGWFYVKGEGHWSPATAVSLGFENPDGRSWILEVPTDRITFVQDESADPSVNIRLNGDGDLGIIKTRTPESCSLRIMAGWWVCEQGPVTTTYSVTPQAEQAGLSPIIAQAFAENAATATITLTPDQYDALLKQG